MGYSTKLILHKRKAESCAIMVAEDRMVKQHSVTEASASIGDKDGFSSIFCSPREVDIHDLTQVCGHCLRVIPVISWSSHRCEEMFTEEPKIGTFPLNR